MITLNFPESDDIQPPEVVFFDIETGPLDREALASQLPPFDPAEVKVGNIKDPALIAAKIESARANHEAQFFAKAALSPATGQIVAFGMLNHSDMTADLLFSQDKSEAEVIGAFFERFRQAQTNSRVVFIGHNIYDFDLPFIVNRARILGLPIPLGLFKFKGPRVNWNDRLIDTRYLWLMGRKPTETQSSLDHCAAAFGLGQKTGNGADFAALAVTDRPAAEAYLRQDLLLTASLAQKLFA